MRTDWKNLKGKHVLVRSIHREKWMKTYGEIIEVEVLNVSPNGLCAKLLDIKYREATWKAEWFHRDSVKLVEVLE